jgi:hypothetical protein
MKLATRYMLAWIPAVVTVGGWQLAQWAFVHFSCQFHMKSLAPCFAGTLNITPLLGFGLFWLQLLAWVCVPLSVWLTIVAYGKHLTALRDRGPSSSL